MEPARLVQIAIFNPAALKIKNKILSQKIVLFSIIAVFLLFFILISSWSKIMIGRLDQKSAPMSSLETDIRKIVGRHPIEKMAPYIAEYDRKTAAFIVSVAKKESDWGEHVPKFNGKDCFNYWGYRGNEGKITWDGYSCFSSREEAVRVIARRFNDLINNSNLDTPRKMIVWKCGWDCNEHSPESVEKWISDVDYYFKKFY